MGSVDIKGDGVTLVDLKTGVEIKLADTALLERYRNALIKIACLDDKGANDRLKVRGSYAAFDEPGSVEIARKALGL